MCDHLYLDPPVLSTDSPIIAEIGNSLSVSCNVNASAQTDIHWTKVDSHISNISDHEVISELTFLVTQDLLNERLMCKAQNEFNSSVEYIHLQERYITTPVSSDHRGSEETEEPDSKKGSESTKDPAIESRSQKSYGVVIVAVIVCILLLAILGAVLYFLYKKGRIPCGRSGTKDITKPGEKEQIVVEMKPDSPAEESVLLPGAQDKKQTADQVTKWHPRHQKHDTDIYLHQ
ncbi:unnamed protein product [Ranitomeya imitator]|uniref:Ig-like domain-containing protein n=1 Tax=Ranitomeya imitator TaxID=111125 RepID=A0ABN9LHZ5_9NEOB|nr:unnamed protein product [Ranitomeya imitator]